MYNLLSFINEKFKLETAVNKTIAWLDASQEGSKEEYEEKQKSASLLRVRPCVSREGAKYDTTYSYVLFIGFIFFARFSISFSFRCVGVWQNDHVEIIPNDRGNRTTPSYVSFSDSGRLIGEAAKNQISVNPSNT